MSDPVARASPFDEVAWPDRLTARVVTPGPRPRVHGYDAEADLARGWSFAEGVLLALTGELPSEAQGRAFEVALHFLAPAPVNEAPTHAAVLARLCAGSDAAVIGTAAVGLAEQARAAVARNAELLSWLDHAEGTPPRDALARDDEDRESVDRLRAALGPTGLRVHALDHELSRASAIVATLHACGLVRPHAIETAWVVARLATAVAEAMSNKRRSFLRYPMQLPHVRYQEDR